MGAALQRALVDSWRRRGPLAWVLWPLSALYGGAVALRRWLYRTGFWRTESVPVPVVVVGNVVAGGGGKTPLVLAIVRRLQKQGYRVGVVSRGHGRNGRDCREVLGDSAPIEVGDEPLLIQQSTGAKVFVAARRIDAARALLQANPTVDVLVSDDGLQHLALQRDLEVCVFGAEGAGNRLLLPAGPLREHWPRPVDFVVSDGSATNKGDWSSVRKLAPLAHQADGTELPLRAFRMDAHPAAGPLSAVAGIALPQAFFEMLRKAGIEPAHTVALPDHAPFDELPPDIRNAKTLLCTEKDAVKLWRHRPDAWAVRLELQLPDAFWDKFDRTLRERAGAKLSSGHGHKTA